MNKIEKLLRKLRAKEREAILLIMIQVKKDFRKIPHIQPLTGRKDWFRVRVGRYRIIFSIVQGRVEIRRITKRDDRTYTNLN